jgi:hypothetical protein
MKACAQTSGDDETWSRRSPSPACAGEYNALCSSPFSVNSPAGSRSPTHRIEAHLKRKLHEKLCFDGEYSTEIWKEGNQSGEVRRALLVAATDVIE